MGFYTQTDLKGPVQDKSPPLTTSVCNVYLHWNKLISLTLLSHSSGWALLRYPILYPFNLLYKHRLRCYYIWTADSISIDSNGEWWRPLPALIQSHPADAINSSGCLACALRRLWQPCVCAWWGYERNDTSSALSFHVKISFSNISFNTWFWDKIMMTLSL